MQTKQNKTKSFVNCNRSYNYHSIMTLIIVNILVCLFVCLFVFYLRSHVVLVLDLQHLLLTNGVLQKA